MVKRKNKAKWKIERKSDQGESRVEYIRTEEQVERENIGKCYKEKIWKNKEKRKMNER